MHYNLHLNIQIVHEFNLHLLNQGEAVWVFERHESYLPEFLVHNVDLIILLVLFPELPSLLYHYQLFLHTLSKLFKAKDLVVKDPSTSLILQ